MLPSFHLTHLTRNVHISWKKSLHYKMYIFNIIYIFEFTSLGFVDIKGGTNFQPGHYTTLLFREIVKSINQRSPFMRKKSHCQAQTCVTSFVKLTLITLSIYSALWTEGSKTLMLIVAHRYVNTLASFPITTQQSRPWTEPSMNR